MSIIDRARDALKRLGKSGRAGMFQAAADIHEMGPEAVNAVVRVADLADELDESHQTRARTIDRREVAARIRAALEEGEQ